MSTRALQRKLPDPLQLRVIVPAPVALPVSPFFKVPLNPGAAMRQDGSGRAFGVSENAARQVNVTGPVISNVSGCVPDASLVAWSE